MTPTAEKDNQKLIDKTLRGSKNKTMNIAKAKPYQTTNERLHHKAKRTIKSIIKALCVGTANPANAEYINADKKLIIAAACCDAINKHKLGKIRQRYLIKKKTSVAIKPICRPDIAIKWLVPVAWRTFQASFEIKCLSPTVRARTKGDTE